MSEKFQAVHRLKRISNYVRNVKHETVGLSHGCFDILGPGHIEHLLQAKKMCDCLIVTISSDEVVKKNKGQGRPIIPAVDRVKHLAALECVDHVAVWGQMDCCSVLRDLKPTYYFKGDDTKVDQGEGWLREKNQCAQSHIQIHYTTSQSVYHTSDIVRVIQGEASSPS